jgi:hypothetical protein
VLGPLIAALAARPRVTAAFLALTIALAAISLADRGMSGQDVVRLVTVVAGAAIAVWIGELRARIGEALGLLEVVFEHAPVGIALLDTDLRVLRVNERLQRSRRAATCWSGSRPLWRRTRRGSCAPACR